MRTLNLSGFKPSDSLTLSVSQGALTAGPINVPAWGAPNTGGTITITVDRSVLKCAPDSVRLGVDLSSSTFDTPGPVGSAVYDARLHDLIYLWDFDDLGTWSVPVNVMASWKNRSTAKGPWVAHMYAAPGTYNPSVLVIEPSSGKTATASVSVTVADPDDIYPGAQTICVNPVGDNDFAGKPLGAKEIQVDELLNSSPEWIAEQKPANLDNPPIRWLFKRGKSSRLFVHLYSQDVPYMTFGAYGAGARPVMTTYTGTTEAKFNIRTSRYHGEGRPVNSDAPVDIRLVGLNFQGNFDPETEFPPVTRPDATGGAVWTLGQSDLMIHDCRFSGSAGSTIYFGSQYQTLKSHVHMNDTLITDFGGQYPFFSDPYSHEKSSSAITGCGIVQNPSAISSHLTSAPVRINETRFCHIRGSDFFHVDDSQPCLKLIETAGRDGLVVNVHSCSLEGGLCPIMFCGNTASQGIQRISAHNCVIDGLVVVGMYRTLAFIRSRATGVTFRNSLFVQPATPYFINTLDQILLVSDFYNTPFDPDVVGAAPIAIYNNTFRIDRTHAENGNRSPDFKGAEFYTDESGDLTNVLNENNVFHYPNTASPYSGFQPLTDDALWTPRNIGRTDSVSQTLDTQYASPADAVKETRPMPGSAALGAALSGNVSYMDILGTTRTAPADKGAWEVA